MVNRRWGWQSARIVGFVTLAEEAIGWKLQQVSQVRWEILEVKTAAWGGDGADVTVDPAGVGSSAVSEGLCAGVAEFHLPHG
jgi:hypothetical protein